MQAAEQRMPKEVMLNQKAKGCSAPAPKACGVMAQPREKSMPQRISRGMMALIRGVFLKR